MSVEWLGALKSLKWYKLIRYGSQKYPVIIIARPMEASWKNCGTWYEGDSLAYWSLLDDDADLNRGSFNLQIFRLLAWAANKSRNQSYPLLKKEQATQI